MAIYRATPEETAAFYGQGLIIFDQQLIKAYRRQYEEKKRREQEEAKKKEHNPEQKGDKNELNS
jgi:hypothetical protein